MASRRSLGGGRILGSGNSLLPPPATNSHGRNNGSLLSPSESSVSLSSQTSSAVVSTSTEIEDIRARVAIHDNEHGPSALATNSSRLVCPICNEEMVTLLQLNRHLDDNHQNLEEVQQDEVKTWFDQQVKKAKKFQPLAVLNQKLRGLEQFEPNGAPNPPSIGHVVSHNPSSRQASPAPELRPDPDDVVTRAHWQRTTGHDACADPVCGRRLGGTHGCINCRHCGKLFCDEHTMYQMKLSRAAQHEPVRGFWCRVCETCYKSRDGYNDHNGLERNHFNEFLSTRRRTVDKAYLEISRLERRLTRLTQLLANPPPPDQNQSASGFLWASISGPKNHIRALEQTVVTWEDDATVMQCPFCQQTFSQYSFRRHHCRICGRVVCGDPTTGCSSEIALNVDTVTDGVSEKGVGQKGVDIRMCQDCQHTIFSKSDFARELSMKPPDQRAYDNLTQFEKGIRLLTPKFQRLLLALQDPDKPPTPTQLADATKVRKRLMDAFTQYDVAARRIRDLPTDSPTQARLQKAIHAQATTFLHLHMLPLKSLPKIMRHATPSGNRSNSTSSTAPNTRPTNGALAAIKYDSHPNNGGTGEGRPGSSRASSTSSVAITALEAEEKELRERLIVLEEQKFFVQEMIAGANKQRRFDEVAALAQNVDDLTKEVDAIQGQLAGMDFAGAYGAAGRIGGAS